MDIYVTVSRADVAFAALCFRFEIGDSAMGGGQAAALLGRANFGCRGRKHDEQRSQKK
jgi:hypothetical protein